MATDDRRTNSGKRPRRQVLRFALVGVVVVACALLATLILARHILVASLPVTSGSRTLPGLAHRLTVERDALGIPTIRGNSRLDVARATGYVHAQDRFFEMDVARRFAAGELAELVGPAALPNDEKYRIHRLRDIARQVLANGSAQDRAVIQAYADGVNAGLDALGARPPEYLLLRSRPVAWLAEDSILVVCAMFGNDLENASRERHLDVLYARLPAPLADFLRPLGDEWDAPLVGDPMVPPPIPSPEVFTLRDGGPPALSGAPHERSPFVLRRPQDDQPFLFVLSVLEHAPWLHRPRSESDSDAGQVDANAAVAGSNSWAIGGAHTADGRALVANDPHLPLQVPNIWYRLSIAWPDQRGGTRHLTGASLPGLPFVAIGSNGHIAWGFTVAFDDRSDMVVVERESQGSDVYRTPDGPRTIEHHVEWIKVKGRPDVRFDIRSTIWGPIVGRDARGREIAMQWQAHHADGVNLAFAQMESAATVGEALDIANRSGLPSYNVVVADEAGSIGWTVTGRLPRRIGFDGRLPRSWADGTRRWDGWLEPGEYPRIVNPPSGRLWTSNNRTVGPPLLDRLGREGYVTGQRARQVRDDLLALDRPTPRDSLRVQLDDRAVFLDRWRTLLLDVLRRDARPTAQRREFRDLVEKSWDGRASTSSVGYTLVAGFRYDLSKLVIGPLVPREEQQGIRPGAIIEWWESALWRLVHEQPRHLLAPRWRNWDEVMLAAVDAAIANVTAGGRPLASASWGGTTTTISHPLARAVPALGRWLNMPFVPLPGDTNLPRVRMPGPTGDVSATLRMDVSPGHEESGIFHMPCGQSGHFLSPHYGDMQQDWVEGRPTPFLPGRTVETLTLRPAGR